jgi:hypothetical protein
MRQPIRLSEHPVSQHWLARFRTAEDRALAAQLLNHLKLVSAREFETDIEQALIDLQKEVKTTIAVYPVAPPLPYELAGYDPFTGGISRDNEAYSQEAGRRRQFGSEDRVGHLLGRLQNRFRRGTGSSFIECAPTLNQLKTQGIRHLVFVDDVCGSGERLLAFWRIVPKRIKSLLSLKRAELWIVLYAITPLGITALKKGIPRFPIESHLKTVLPAARLHDVLSPEVITLCVRYGRELGIYHSSLGYRGSACPIVFEHGCPNNLPAILWVSNRDWVGLFPNRSIPSDLRRCFDNDGATRAIDAVWRANQPKLALGLIEALDYSRPLESDLRMLLILLGLRLRRVSVARLVTQTLITKSRARELFRLAAEMGLYELSESRVTSLGREFVQRFRERFGREHRRSRIGKDPSGYYPGQCEGEFRTLGKTGRPLRRPVPMASQ